MRKMIFITGFALSIFFGCRAQDSVSHIDPVPFAIERSSMNVILPDSLGGEELNGFSVLRLLLDAEGVIQDMEIIKLMANDAKGNSNIEYLDTTPNFRKDYPEEVVNYYDYFYRYVKSLKVIKDPEVIPKSKNELSLMVRF